MACSEVVIALRVRNDAGQLIGAVVTFLVGLWSYQAAGAFAAVATTDTADQRFLMEGFSLLRRVFLLQAVFVIIVLGIPDRRLDRRDHRLRDTMIASA